MRMKIDIDNLRRLIENDALIADRWGDPKEAACLMAALTGRTLENECVAEGWPLWLVQMGEWINDSAESDEERASDAITFAEAALAADERGADWNRIFRDLRLRAILPIAMDAMDAMDEGDEPWRIQCRDAVQWSIDHDGEAAAAAAKATKAARAAKAAKAEAAWAVNAAGAAGTAWAAGAAAAADAAWATGAADAAGAAGAAEAVSTRRAAAAAWAKARRRIIDTLCALMRGEEQSRG